MKWELVPEGIHRKNMTKKTTKIFKGKFQSILCGVSDDFPLNKWDRLIPQVELTYNLLHQSNLESNASTQVYEFGPHDFNIMTLVPL